MGAAVLTTASTVQCPHGGQATLSTVNTVAKAEGAAMLLQTDQHTISGCPFQVPVGAGTKPQPCITLRWTAGATQTKVNGTPVLLQTSSGLCYSAESIPQGPPVVMQAAARVAGS